ncbi:COG8 [Symbiodinium sp. CCMP2592]|nr:COG8 [Symbiodinium sp. CCMP2592]
MIGSLDSIAARLESIQERPDLVCKRKAHMRDPEESSRPPAKWRARCGWPYGYSNFTRAHDDGSQNLCLKCFPEAGAESRKKAAGQPPSDTESTDSYAVMDTGLRALLLDAGASEDLIAYVATKGILSTAIFAEMGEDVKEFDQAMVQPLSSPFKLHDGKVFEVSDAELPVARARLRHAWRKAREKSAPNTASSSPTTTAAAATATSKTKELPPGYWQQQIHKYESVLIHGVPRKFPEMTAVFNELRQCALHGLRVSVVTHCYECCMASVNLLRSVLASQTLRPGSAKAGEFQKLCRHFADILVPLVASHLEALFGSAARLDTGTIVSSMVPDLIQAEVEYKLPPEAPEQGNAPAEPEAIRPADPPLEPPWPEMPTEVPTTSSDA